MQTLVENSVKHNAKRVGALSIRVDITRTGDTVEIRVEDDGVGFDTEPGDDEGRGLSRLAETLRILHGGAASLRREAGEAGARVVIQVPA